MPDEIVIQTQPTPELPKPDTAIKMAPVVGAYNPPAVMTSMNVRKKAMKDLLELSRITGKQYSL